LPFSAARRRLEMKGLAPEVRYRLCLMERTFGSAAVFSMNFST